MQAGEGVPDLEQLELDGDIIFTPLGGENLVLWRNRLERLNIPEFHLYDRDNTPPAPPKHRSHIDEINERRSCYACSTGKREAENYIHYEAINAALQEAGRPVQLTKNFADFDDVPSLFATQMNTSSGPSDKWSDGRAKKFLCNQAAAKMTVAMLSDIDPQNEVRGWLNKISEFLQHGRGEGHNDGAWQPESLEQAQRASG